MVKRFEVYLVSLDDERARARNTRPCVVVSPDEMNHHLGYVIIAPISAVTAGYPTRIPIELLKNQKAVVLDQLQTIDKDRLVKKIDDIPESAQERVLGALKEMFEE